MQSQQKKARIENINELKHNTASKDSIAMENPAYIATEQEGSTSNFPVKHKKHVTPEERQALLHRRNKEFTTRRPKTASEDASMTETGNDDTEPLQQPEVMIYGNTLNFIQQTVIQNRYTHVWTTNHHFWTDMPSSMFPSIKESDAPTQSLDNKVGLWPDIPSTMLQTIKEVHGRIQSFCNDDHGKFINYILILLYKNILYT